MMEYEVSLQTTAWFNGLSDNSTLQISPKFQRRAVWLEKERSELISTICSGLPFPEIYVHVVTDPTTGRQEHIVVDGQQRITSILMFIRGELRLPNDENWNGERFTDLDDTAKGNFWDYKVVVRFLRKTNDAEIRDLFERLNTNNIALNDQEIRNAKYRGVFRNLALRLADDPKWQEFGLFTPRDVRRMLDVEFVSELLVLLIHGISNKKDLVDDFYARYEEELPNEAQIEAEFGAVLSLLWSIFDADHASVFRTKSNFYTLFGSMKRYIRQTKRRSFRNTERVRDAILSLVNSARDQQFHEERPEIEEYADAVSRAASDKGRRAKREEIVWSIISQADGNVKVEI